MKKLFRKLLCKIGLHRWSMGAAKCRGCGIEDRLMMAVLKMEMEDGVSEMRTRQKRVSLLRKEAAGSENNNGETGQ